MTPFTKYCEEVRHKQRGRRSIILNWRSADRVWPIGILVTARRMFQNEQRMWSDKYDLYKKVLAG